MKNIKVLLVLISLALGSCGTGEETQISEVAQKLLEQKINEASEGKVTLKSFEKVNGIKREIFGQQIYEFEYKVEIEMVTDVEITSNISGYFWQTFSIGTFWRTPPFTKDKFYGKGSVVEITGTLHLEKTDNGWRTEGSYKNKSWRDITYIPRVEENENYWFEEGRALSNADRELSYDNQKTSTATISTKTYFFESPNGKRKKAYLITGDTISIIEERDGFIYVEYTNAKGQITKGWINKDNVQF